MGDTLIGQVTEATGLPDDLIQGELERLLNRAGLKRADVTLDDLRQVLADYMQEVLLDAKEEHAASDAGSCTDAAIPFVK